MQPLDSRLDTDIGQSGNQHDRSNGRRGATSRAGNKRARQADKLQRRREKNKVLQQSCNVGCRCCRLPAHLQVGAGRRLIHHSVQRPTQCGQECCAQLSRWICCRPGSMPVNEDPKPIRGKGQSSALPPRNRLKLFHSNKRLRNRRQRGVAQHWQRT